MPRLPVSYQIAAVADAALDDAPTFPTQTAPPGRRPRFLMASLALMLSAAVVTLPAGRAAATEAAIVDTGQDDDASAIRIDSDGGSAWRSVSFGPEESLQLPDGFQINVFAQNLDGVRFMTIGPDGDLYA